MVFTPWAVKYYFLILKPDYVGYIAWRGLQPFAILANNPITNSELSYYVYEHGHSVAFSIMQSEKYLNWLIYEKVSATDLANLLKDKNGQQHSHSIAPGLLTTEHLQHLQQLAMDILPENFAKTICKTTSPFIQAIHELNLDKHRQNRLILLGDAAGVLRPHIASGATQALRAAISLRETLQSNNTIDAALTEWESKEITARQQLAKLAEIMGDALVLNSPSWQQMDQAKMDQWWKCMMQGRQWYVTDYEDAN